MTIKNNSRKIFFKYRTIGHRLPKVSNQLFFGQCKNLTFYFEKHLVSLYPGLFLFGSVFSIECSKFV